MPLHYGPLVVVLLAVLLLLPGSVRSDDDADDASETGTLFFSSYVEGSGFNKAFGIYNPTGSAVDLATYAMQVCYNGCAEDWYGDLTISFPSGATAATGEEYVVCDESATDEMLLSMCSTTEKYMSSGNDAFRLVKCASSCGGTCTAECEEYAVIDSLGAFEVAPDPPITGWDVCGVSHATKDHTFLRKADVCAGTGANWDAEADFDTCTWVVYGKNEQFDAVGLHTTTDCMDNGGRVTRAPIAAPTLSPTPGLAVAEATMCPAAPEVPEDRRKDKSRLRLGQWNMDFLMLPEIASTGSMHCPCAGLSCADESWYAACSAANCCGWGRLDARAHLRYVATEVMAIDADVLHVVEIGDCSVLEELLKLLPPDHGYKAYMVKNYDTFTGEHVGLLTRVDPVEDLRYDSRRVAYPVSAGPLPLDDDGGSDAGDDAAGDDDDDDDASSRLPAGTFTPSECSILSGATGTTGMTKHLVARLMPVEVADDDGGFASSRVNRDDEDDDSADTDASSSSPKHITLVGMHTLARPDDASRCGKREAQAVLGATIAAEAIVKGDHAIIVGDMNDFDPGAPQASGIASITNTLDILRNATTVARTLAAMKEAAAAGDDTQENAQKKESRLRRAASLGRDDDQSRRRADDSADGSSDAGPSADDGADESSSGGTTTFTTIGYSGSMYKPMLNLVELVPQEERYSEWWDQNGDCVDNGVSPVQSRNEYSQLDHMFLSSGLEAMVIEGSAAIHHDWTGMCLKDGGMYSDHWPLTIDLYVPGFETDDGSANEGSSTAATSDCSADEEAVMAASAAATILAVVVIVLLLVVVVLWKKAGCSGCECNDAERSGVFSPTSNIDFDSPSRVSDMGMSPNPMHRGGKAKPMAAFEMTEMDGDENGGAIMTAVAMDVAQEEGV